MLSMGIVYQLFSYPWLLHVKTKKVYKYCEFIDNTNRRPKSNAMFCIGEGVKNVKSQLFFLFIDLNKMYIKS